MAAEGSTTRNGGDDEQEMGRETGKELNREMERLTLKFGPSALKNYFKKFIPSKLYNILP